VVSTEETNVPQSRYPVQPLGGDSFNILLDTAVAEVWVLKLEVAREIGVEAYRQELFKVAVAANGSAVREDDADPELLADSDLVSAGELLMLSVNEPLVWRSYPSEFVSLSEDGAVATKTSFDGSALVTSCQELTSGQHYWEIQLLSAHMDGIYIGVCRPKLDPAGDYCDRQCLDAWFIETSSGSLFGNGKFYDDRTDGCKQGDRIGVLVDLDDHSLLYFKNGVPCGPGHSGVTGPVVHAVQFGQFFYSARLIPDAKCPHYLLDGEQVEAQAQAEGAEGGGGAEGTQSPGGDSR
jgi:hypothetical protein